MSTCKGEKAVFVPVFPSFVLSAVLRRVVLRLLLGLVGLLYRRFGGVGEDVDILELAAGRYEWPGRLLLAHAYDGHALLAQSGGETGEVAVGGGETEAVDAPRIEDIHGVDDHRRVGGVLARRV